MRYKDFKVLERKQKTGSAGQAKGKDTMPKAKPGRTTHPLKNKLVGESIINEAARIDHAEDIIFWEGSRGAVRAIESLKSLEQGSHKDVTIKWDGSPAVIFGRNEDGEFIFTDKSGFSAKGYDGKATSAKALKQMLSNRPGASNPDPAKQAGYQKLIGNMTSAYNAFEKSVSKDFRGYLKGDMLYFNTPKLEGDAFVFTPNIVTYTVKANSSVGQQIKASTCGIVIHRLVDEAGTERSLAGDEVERIVIGNEVLVLPPVTVQQPPNIDDSSITALKKIVSKNASAIDSILDSQKLRDMKITDLPKIFYAYVNSKVDTGMSGLAKDFIVWLKQSKVSAPKQQKIIDLINSNVAGYNAIWQIVEGIMKVKDNIINQLENQEADIKASIKGEQGGEGYVLAHPEGDIKLVPREYFSKANRAVER